MNSMLPMLLLYSLPALIPILIVSIKKRNRQIFIERNGYTPEAFEEVEKLKKMLDCGMITQEEFEQKKKQLLNL